MFCDVPFRVLSAFLFAMLVVGCGAVEEKATLDGSGGATFVPASASAGALTGYLARRPAAAALVDRLVADGDYERDALVKILSQVEQQPWIIDLMDRQAAPSKSPGPTGAWTRYRARFVNEDNIVNGVAFWRRYDSALSRAEARYGVPAEYVVAIIGVETRYGAYLGKTRIIDALATLAFDYPRRADYFTGELESFLRMCRSERIDPLLPRGSYAGAMGLGQFMPTSFHRYAVDFSGDGQRDLWSPVDAIGSVANYLSAHGWQRGAAVVIPAQASGHEPGSMKAGFRTRYSPVTLASRGIRPVTRLPERSEVSLLELDGAGGYEYWLGLDNFLALTSYNHSTYYAMSVHQLAEALRRARGPAATLAER